MPEKSPHSCLHLSVGDLRAFLHDRKNVPVRLWGRILYGLNYNGQVEMYDVALPEIQYFYNNLAESLTDDVICSKISNLEDSETLDTYQKSALFD